MADDGWDLSGGVRGLFIVVGAYLLNWWEQEAGNPLIWLFLGVTAISLVMRCGG